MAKNIKCKTDEARGEMLCTLQKGKRKGAVLAKAGKGGLKVVQEEGDMDLNKELKKHMAGNIEIKSSGKKGKTDSMSTGENLGDL